MALAHTLRQRRCPIFRAACHLCQSLGVEGGWPGLDEELPSDSIHASEATCCACQRLDGRLGGRKSHLQAIKKKGLLVP